MVELEVGKYYKTRDGRKVGPMRASRVDDKHPFVCDIDPTPECSVEVAIWEIDGKNYELRNLDIVSEWVDYSSCEAAQVDVQSEEYGPIPKRSQIIALSGPAGSGKSTAAAYLVERHGFTLVKFATPLKNMLRAVGLTEREIEGELKEVPNDKLCGRTPRYAMQTLGTEWGRDLIGDTFWVNLWAREAARYDRVVCDDCRFENEASVVRNMGGVIVGITGRGGISGSHVSENGVTPDMSVNNSDNVKKMHYALDRLVSRV